MHIPKRPGEPDCTWADISKIRVSSVGSRKSNLSEGVKIMLENIDYWRDAPVWTVSSIADATADWFKYLGADDQAERHLRTAMDASLPRWTTSANGRAKHATRSSRSPR